MLMFDYIDQKHRINTRTGKYSVQYIFKNTGIAAKYGYHTYVCSIFTGKIMDNEVAVYAKNIDESHSLYAVVDILSTYQKHRVAPVQWCMIPSELDEFGAVSNFMFVTFEQLADKYIELRAKCSFVDWIQDSYGGFAITNIYKETFMLGKCAFEWNGNKYKCGERLRIIGSNTKKIKVEFLTAWRQKQNTVEVPMSILHLVPVKMEVGPFYPNNCVLGL